MSLNNRKVRVRFAPSPTGPLHMGGVRTALYNYLFAKKNGGDFLIRIEDTDQTRLVPGAQEYIFEALGWCGIHADESPETSGPHAPYIQSERKHLYRKFADELIENGNAYIAFDTAEELEAAREKASASGSAGWQYNHATRSYMKNSLSLSQDEVEKRIHAGEPYVIRAKLPRNEEIRFLDIIRGWVTVNSSNLDDKVLFKSDGMPTYHLANIVDDHLMEITHVIRGEEWLPSAPLHVMLYRFFNWQQPEFAHLPLLLRPDGNGKLSKRDGDRLGFPVFPLEWKDPATGEVSSGYREKGYYQGAFINMLALLGWNPGTTQEIFTMDELIDAFSLERVGKSGSKFDPEKTKWFNQQYLRMQPNEVLAEQIKPILPGSEPICIEYLAAACGLMKERATFASDIVKDGSYLFVKPTYSDFESLKKKWKPETQNWVLEFNELANKLTEYHAGSIEHLFNELIQAKGIGTGALLPILRYIITGAVAGPSLFHICELLGKDETRQRLETGLNEFLAFQG